MSNTQAFLGCKMFYSIGLSRFAVGQCVAQFNAAKKKKLKLEIETLWTWVFVLKNYLISLFVGDSRGLNLRGLLKMLEKFVIASFLHFSIH